jgi:hypothetical protein
MKKRPEAEYNAEARDKAINNTGSGTIETALNYSIPLLDPRLQASKPSTHPGTNVGRPKVHLRSNTRAFLSSHSMHTTSEINELAVLLSEAVERLTTSGHHSPGSA